MRNGQRPQESCWSSIRRPVGGTDRANQNKLPDIVGHSRPPELLLEKMQSTMNSWMAVDFSKMTQLKHRRLGRGCNEQLISGIGWSYWASWTSCSINHTGNWYNGLHNCFFHWKARLTGKGVRLYVIGTRLVGYCKVKSPQEKSPRSLVRVQSRGRLEITKILTVSPHSEWMSSSL